MSKITTFLSLTILAAMIMVGCRQAPGAIPAAAPTEAPEQEGDAEATATPQAEEEGDMAMFDGTIKVAFLGPLTGGAAFIGQEQKGFVQVFIDTFAAETGLTVELVEGDTEINPDTGKIVAEQV
ncbi:MAG: hypothetical protein AAF629_36455, partial [Chloroflexota bacterium]